MDYRIVVKPSNGRLSGWLMEHYDWEGPEGPAPNPQPMVWQDIGNDKFAAAIPCSGSRCCLACTLTAGVKVVVVSVEPDAEISYPAGAEWPHSMESDGPMDLVTVCFRVGGE